MKHKKQYFYQVADAAGVSQMVMSIQKRAS
jgi:hypothetical protein